MKDAKYAAIFDMDGVLVDTYDMMWSSHNQLLSKYGVHLTDKDIALYAGSCAKDNVKSWNKRFDLNLDPEEYCKTAWAVQAELFKNLSVEKNLVNFLEQLHNSSIPKGVGTSAHKSRVIDILRNTSLEKYLPIVVASEDVTRHKPAPDVYLEVARRLNVSPENCVVFEDARSGIQAAKAGNMKAVGYLGKHNSIDDLTEADTIIKDFSEINPEKLYHLFAA